MGKTRKEHKCEICGKIIPKGTPTDKIIIESAGGRVLHKHSLGSHHASYSYWGYRRYYHRDCYIMKELCEIKKPFYPDFFVQRTITSVVYNISGNEIEILLIDNPHTRENWNRAVEKDNEIYEFARKNGLLMYPELDLKRIQEVDIDCRD